MRVESINLDPARRSMSPDHSGHGAEPLSLADAGPLLLVTTASLAQFNDWIGDDAEPMVIERFRPNVVIDSVDEPFVEDGWRQIRIGEVSYRLAEHCDRCVVTTIDPIRFGMARSQSAPSPGTANETARPGSASASFLSPWAGSPSVTRPIQASATRRCRTRRPSGRILRQCADRMWPEGLL